MHLESKQQSLKRRLHTFCRSVQVLLEAVSLHFSCQDMVAELLPPDGCRWQAPVAHKRWNSAVTDRSAAPQRYEMSASSVCGRQDTKDEIFTEILHSHHAMHTAYMQKMGRDKEDLRSFAITYPY